MNYASCVSRVSVAFCNVSPTALSRYLTFSKSVCNPQRTSASSRNVHSSCFGRFCSSKNVGRLTRLNLNLTRTSRASPRILSAPQEPSRQPIYAFDKVPTTRPDWWDDEEEEDLDDCHALRFENTSPQVALGSGSGSFARNGRDGGSGGGEDGKFNGDSEGPDRGLFAVLLATYLRAMSRNPILVKAITTSVIAFLGDVLAQFLTQIGSSEVQWDMRRTLSITIWGFCFIGPTLHYWFSTLDRLYTNKYSVLCKLLTDQLLFAPFFNSAFMIGVGTLEGHSFKEVTETVKSKLWTALKANWMLWPAAQFINFSFVPKNLQVVYVNCVALVWNMIFMYISHSEHEAVA
ncbi:unnamed protein product [Agarophyton chilense]